MPTGATVALVVALRVFVSFIARNGYSGTGGDTIVRCRRGHLFTTNWIVGLSVKAVRLGYEHNQRCPVCRKCASSFPGETTSSPSRTGASRQSTTTRSCLIPPEAYLFSSAASANVGLDQAACDWVIQVSYISA